MRGDQLNRDKMITEWFFQDWIGDQNYLPEPEDVFIFMKVVIDAISTCGEINEQDRKYILGRAAIFGATQEILEKLQIYHPHLSNDTNEIFQNFHLPHVQKTRLGVIYNLFRILGIDHKLHPKQLESIYTVAKKLGATEEQIQQIQNIYEEENKLREKRASLFYPQGMGDALIEYHKLY